MDLYKFNIHRQKRQVIHSSQVKFLMFLFLSVFMIVSCKENKTKSSEQNEKQNSIIVGFSQIGAESAWRTCNTESMKKAAREAGIQLLYENAEQKQENQIKALRSFIAYQVDVIVFVPIVQKVGIMC